MKSFALFLFLLFALALPAAAQTNSWISVQGLPKGIDLIIERKQDNTVIGTLQATTADTIAVSGSGGSFIIGRDNVKKVYHALPGGGHRHANHGALIGMIVGAVVTSAAAGEPEGQETPGLPGLIGGGLAGAWIGSKRDKGPRKGDLIYVAK